MSARTGSPVTSTTPPRRARAAKKAAISGWATAITSTSRDTILLVCPGTRFPSSAADGTPSSRAASSTGPETYPPVPSTASGRNSRAIRKLCKSGRPRASSASERSRRPSGRPPANP